MSGATVHTRTYAPQHFTEYSASIRIASHKIHTHLIIIARFGSDTVLYAYTRGQHTRPLAACCTPTYTAVVGKVSPLAIQHNKTKPTPRYSYRTVRTSQTYTTINITTAQNDTAAAGVDTTTTKPTYGVYLLVSRFTRVSPSLRRKREGSGMPPTKRFSPKKYPQR